MVEYETISPIGAFAATTERGALLVATYETGFNFEINELSGAIPSDMFHQMEPGLPTDKEIIFY